MNRQALDTHQKALEVNLDPQPYGTLAEIGAGQEVARWFFRVGGAAGTIAKTMSAYDMTVSDAIYGAADRYVSRARLQRMLDHEYQLLLDRLNPSRGPVTRFFAFANTVTAKSYSRQDEAHGWMGIRFQAEPQAPPSQVMIHIHMLDKENVQEQEALGVIGVNLVHAALYHFRSPDVLISRLLDNLTRERIEVDLIKCDGPAFAAVDNRLLSLQLVQQNLTEATLLTADGQVVQAAEVLYKKPILVVRGSFRPITNATVDVIESARRRFAQEPSVNGEAAVVITEMTLRHLAEGGVIDHRDFLERAETLGALGLNVLVSNFARYFRLAAYLVRHNKKMIGIAMGVRRLREMFDEGYYTDLEGGILEAFGRMFRNDLKLYIYPVVEGEDSRLVTAQSLDVAPHLRGLYDYLLRTGHVQDLSGYDESNLRVFARDVLSRIRTGDETWSSLVPKPVAGMIRERRLFGYQGPGTTRV
jgi:hypothetical protein